MSSDPTTSPSAAPSPTGAAPDGAPARDELVHLVTCIEMGTDSEFVAVRRTFEGAQESAATHARRYGDGQLVWSRTEYAGPQREPSPWIAQHPRDLGMHYTIETATLRD